MDVAKIIRTRKIETLITIAVALMALIGCAVYYTQYVTDVPPDRLWFTVIYSAIGLFFIQSTVPVGIATPLIFEIARLAAPLCTLYWLFAFIESLFHHAVGIFERSMHSEHQIAVIGYDRYSRIFLQNLLEENRGCRQRRQRYKNTLIP